MKPTKRYLVVTADEQGWKFDRPVLFLGEWCRLYNRKSIWDGMDALVAAPYGLEAEQLERDIAYVQAMSSQLLIELADALNTFHGTRHSVRYWHIILGHWLQRYVTVTFNRYFTLEQALNEYEVSGGDAFESMDYNLATVDSMTFIWACSDDAWNCAFYSKILNFWGRIKTGSSPKPIKGWGEFFMQKATPKVLGRLSAKHFILDVAKKVLPKLSREKDAFIINSYLPLKEEIKLQLSLGQCPQLWQSPLLKTVEPVLERRQSFRINAENHSGFEQFVRRLLPELIPSCYLEGYNQLISQVESLPWPAKPRFIFTSNNFDTDEIFKAWVGSKVEEGFLYFTGQHGNNYGTLLGSQNWPEMVTSDKFITWGWESKAPGNIAAFIFKTAGCKPQHWSKDGGLLLIELHSPHRIGPEDNYFDFGIYQEEQFLFVGELPEIIRQHLTVRLHGAYSDFRWHDEQRWRDRCPHTKIETAKVSIQSLIAQSRLVVHSYDSTGILESLSQNIPTICFWQGGLTHLQESAKPYYEKLQQAEILLDSPESAARKVEEVWNDIPAWWYSEEVQSARKIFCDQYARLSSSPVAELKGIFSGCAISARLNT
jgi:putative transferase (TIGR04331 family)